MTVRTLLRPPASAASRAALDQLMVGLAVASAVELLLLRTFTRTAIHIPALKSLATPYHAVSDLGRYSYFVAAVLLLAALPVAASALWRRETLPSRVAAAALAAFVLAAALARAGVVDRLLVDSIAVGAVVVMAAATAGGRDRRVAAVIGAFALAYLLSSGHTMLQDARAQGLPVFGGRWMLTGAELAALAFAVATPFAFHAALTRRSFGLAVAASVITLAMLLGNGSTTRILLLWNEGLSGTFPAAAYALAAGALCASMAGLLGQRRVLAAVGLVLLVTGGFGLHSTYQTALVVTGLAAILLACDAARPARAAQGVATRASLR